MKKKLLFLLVLLLTATTGAMAQSAFTAKEITSASQLTSTDDEAYVAACMPSDFLAVDVNVAKAWTGAPTDGSATLIYAIDGDKIKIATFLNGSNKATTGATWSIATFKTQMANSKFYYTAASGYTVTLKDGVKDADKWTVKVGDGQAQALPIGGLKGDGSETVTLQYTGRLKVKGVKATSDEAAAGKTDLLSGVFSVSSTKKVNFSKGNLRYASSKWSFFDNQYDYYDSYSADAWDKFGWSTSATTYGMNTSQTNSDFSGDFVDWGATMGTGWFTLSSDEWTYLFNTRTVNGGTGDGKSYTKGQSVNGKLGLVIYPDNYTGAVYSGSDWATFESAGCVFLPAAGYRYGSSLSSPGTKGYYWSATPNGTNMAYSVYFISGGLSPAYSFGRRYGCSVRLVREVATSDAEPAKEPATVTTAPTGAAIVGVGKTTALVSGGVADGGTLMYQMTTTNTKPTSTDGFSATVPTAQTITASGKVYVWYFVKADDTHSDSEIAGPVSVTLVEELTWNTTNVFNSSHQKDKLSFNKKTPLVYEGITISYSGDDPASNFYPYVAKEGKGRLKCYGQNGVKFTFTAPSGKKFVRIEMTDDDSVFSGDANWIEIENENKLVWSGTPSNTVEIAGDDLTQLTTLNSIVFYLVDAE